MNLSAQDHQTFFTCEGDCGKAEYESEYYNYSTRKICCLYLNMLVHNMKTCCITCNMIMFEVYFLCIFMSSFTKLHHIFHLFSCHLKTQGSILCPYQADIIPV